MIIITGASGFVGRRLAIESAKRFSSEKHELWASPVKSSFEERGKVELQRGGLRYAEVDLLSPRARWPSLASDTRTVFHLAAETSTWSDKQSANDKGTENLIDHLSPLGPETHVIFTSSIATLDNRATLSAPLGDSLSPDAPPLTRYGRSKVRAEALLKQRSKRDGFKLTIVRLVTVFGSNPRPNSFFEVLRTRIETKSILARLNWPGRTGFVHVDDVVRALLALAQNPPAEGHCRQHILNGETQTLAGVSRILHRGLGELYVPIVLPRLIWGTVWRGWKMIKCVRQVLPARFFNPFWRGHLVVGDIFWSESSTLRQLIEREPKTIEESVGELISKTGAEREYSGYDCDGIKLSAFRTGP